MTIKTLALALGELERLLVVLHASPEAEGIDALGAFLKAHSDAATAAFLKRATPRRSVASGRDGRQVGQLLPILTAYNAMLGKLAGKTGKEFGFLVEFLQHHERADLQDFILAAEEAVVAAKPKKSASSRSQPNEQLVTEYVHKLEPVIGRDDGFSEVFEPLRMDKRARAQEVVEIAKRIMPAPPIKMDRKKALAAIRELHLAAKKFDLKLKASGGRSAA